MHLRELNYVVTLADEGSITRAADRLYMAQSSLSQFLQQYEAELGMALFVRTSKGLSPTAAGNLFIENARSILYHYRLVRNEMYDMEHLQKGQITLGISSFRGSYMLPPILKQFYLHYPKITVNVVEANSIALEEKILEGEVDLALVALPLKKLNHEVEVLKSDEILLVTNKSHPITNCLHKKDTYPFAWVDLKEIIDFEFILSDYDTILGIKSRQAFRKAGLKPYARNTTITAAMAAAMAREGLGLAFTYRSCVGEFNEAVYISIGTEGVYVDLALAYPYAEYRSKAASALGEMIYEFQKNIALSK
ncbi:LysR family transcriptional regulator [Lacrimispora sp.]|uniref:LysR family transcriptional regulator n=1 Tax=Lacrimispora sp. TaxID=2719234 RepID=UPI00345FA6C6